MRLMFANQPAFLPERGVYAASMSPLGPLLKLQTPLKQGTLMRRERRAPTAWRQFNRMVFSLRASDFLRISEFGIRSSDFRPCRAEMSLFPLFSAS